MPAAWAGDAATQPQGRDALKGVTVLAVDDDPDSLEIVQRILEGEGLRVVTAPSAARAHSLVLLVKPRVIIVDLTMPGEDGYQLIRSLRSDDETKTIPILVLSALDSFKSRDQAYALGVNCYLSKPVDRQTLVDSLARILRDPGAPA